MTKTNTSTTFTKGVRVLDKVTNRKGVIDSDGPDVFGRVAVSLDGNSSAERKTVDLDILSE